MLITRPFTNEEVAAHLESGRLDAGMIAEACRRIRGLPASGSDSRARAFSLTFNPMDVLPTKQCEVLLYNQCDGYHQVEARFWDGEFRGFYTFIGTTPYDPTNFAAWAELPDCNADLYPVFADPRPFGERA